MRISYFIILSFALVASVFARPASAQEIKGDTIYTSFLLPATLRFPSGITSCVFADTLAKKNYRNIVISTSVVIKAQTVDARPAILNITEGDRNHSFVLVCKKNPGPKELTHQWPTVEVLKKYAETLEEKKSIAAAARENAKKNIVHKVVADSNTAVIADTASNNYEEMFRQSNALLGKKDYAGSRRFYDKAAALKEKKYREEISAANRAFFAKDFDGANTKYTAALAIKPDDVYAKKSLAASQRKLDSTTEAEKKDDVYDSLVSQGNALIATLDYDKAKEFFVQARDMRPEEKVPVNMLKYAESAARNLKERRRYADSIKRLAATRDTMDKANKQILARNWLQAKELFEKVLTMDPTPVQAGYVNSKIETINLELERLTHTAGKIKTFTPIPVPYDSSRSLNDAGMAAVMRPKQMTPEEETEAKRAEQERVMKYRTKVSEYMDKAQKAYNEKNWDSARAFYKQALAFYPMKDREDFAKSRIAEIDQHITEEKESGQSRIVKQPVLKHDGKKGAADSLAIAIRLTDSLRTTTLLDQARKAMLDKKMDNARGLYNQVIALQFSASQTEFARKKIRVIDEETARKAGEDSIAKKEQLARQAEQDQTAKRAIQVSMLLDKAQQASDTKRWDSAVTLYKEILALSPTIVGENFVRNKIAEVEAAQKKEQLARQAEQERISKQNQQVTETLNNAQQAFDNKKWDTSIALYKQVITLSQSKEQKDFAQNKITEAQAKLKNEQLAMQAEQEKIAKQNQQVTETLNNAQQAFDNKKWDTSIALYKQVITLSQSKEQKNFAQNKITEAQAELKNEKLAMQAEQEKIAKQNQQVTEALNNAQQAFNNKKWDTSIALYKQVITLSQSKEQKDFAQNKIIEAQAELKNEQLARQAEQEKIAKQNQQVTEALNNAQQAFDNKQWDSATILYNRVIALSPSKEQEAFARNKIAEAKKEKEQLALAEDQEKVAKRAIQVSTLLDKAQKAFDAKRWDSATAFYKDIIALSPTIVGENFVRNKIAEVEAEQKKEQLARQAGQDRIAKHNQQITDALGKAEEAFNNKRWDSATALYKKVIDLSPSKEQEDFARGKITETEKERQKEQLAQQAAAKKVQDSLAAATAAKPVEIPKKQADSAIEAPAVLASKISKPDTTDINTNAEATRIKAKVLDLMIDAQQAIKDRQWDSARAIYKQVLALQPSKYMEDFTKKELKTLDLQIAKDAREKVAPKETAAISKNKIAEAVTSSKLTPENTTATGSTDGQKIAETDGSAAENNRFADPAMAGKILEQKPRLNLADSFNSVKLVCQDIVFSGNNAYLRLLVKNNNSTTDFTGAVILLTYIQNYGILKKQFLSHVSDLRPVSPRSEAQLVYAFPAYSDVEADEIFIMEITDKMKRKFTINISGALYNQLKGDQ